MTKTWMLNFKENGAIVYVLTNSEKLKPFFHWIEKQSKIFHLLVYSPNVADIKGPNQAKAKSATLDPQDRQGLKYHHVPSAAAQDAWTETWWRVEESRLEPALHYGRRGVTSSRNPKRTKSCGVPIALE